MRGEVTEDEDTASRSWPKKERSLSERRESSSGLTYADYCSIPEDGLRHEIIGGEHFMTPVPELYHQALVVRFSAELLRRFERSGLGRVFASPVDVQLSDHDVVQPDIVVVLDARREILHRSRIIGAPDLVIEILSPSTRSRDCREKRQLYETHRVSEYWIVDPETRLVEQLRWVGDDFQLVGQHHHRVTFLDDPRKTIELERVW